jgi:hypothetical protein
MPHHSLCGSKPSTHMTAVEQKDVVPAGSPVVVYKAWQCIHVECGMTDLRHNADEGPRTQHVQRQADQQLVEHSRHQEDHHARNVLRHPRAHAWVVHMPQQPLQRSQGRAVRTQWSLCSCAQQSAAAAAGTHVPSVCTLCTGMFHSRQ